VEFATGRFITFNTEASAIRFRNFLEEGFQINVYSNENIPCGADSLKLSLERDIGVDAHCNIKEKSILPLQPNDAMGCCTTLASDSNATCSMTEISHSRRAENQDIKFAIKALAGSCTLFIGGNSTF
jgi:hypothetical protein